METGGASNMKKISFLLAIILVFSLVLTGCGAAKSDAAYDRVEMSKPMEAPMASSAPMYDSGFGSDMKVEAEMDMVVNKQESTIMDGGYNNIGDAIYENPENKIIRSAYISVQTTEFEKSIEALNALTTQFNGYYENSEVSSGYIHDQYANRSAYYVVRIPREHFTAFRDSTGTIGHVSSLNENNQDVGEIYYDTEARLATLTTKRDRLLALLEKAEIMEDIIALESALADVQYQIDDHTGSLRKYDSLINYSTFTVNIQEVEEIVEQPAVTQTFGEKLLSNLKSGVSSFVRDLQYFAYDVARNLIDIAIFAVVVIVIVLIGRKKLKKIKIKRNARKGNPEIENKNEE
jgi:hypothetical protein